MPRTHPSPLLRLVQAWLWSSLAAAVVLTILLIVGGATLSIGGGAAILGTSMLLAAQGTLPVVLLLGIARIVLRRTPLPIAYPTTVALGMMVLGAAAAVGSSVLITTILFPAVELGILFSRVVLPTSIIGGIVAGAIVGRFDHPAADSPKTNRS